MPRGQHGKGYNTAQATPQHNGLMPLWLPRDDDAPALEADPALGCGARCRIDGRRAMALSHAAGEVDASPLTWHAAVTNPGAEFSVRAALQDRGIDTVLPTIRYWRIRNRKRFVAERPLLARCVLFGMNKETQSLVEFVSRYVRDGDQLVRADEPDRARTIVGIERIVRGADDGWAVLPASEIYDLRLRILRGDFDATLREGRARPELPEFIKALIARGELPADSSLTHRELRRKGLKFSVAA